jgi:hypothetical protein
MIHGELADGTNVRVRAYPYEHSDLTMGVLLRGQGTEGCSYLLLPTLADVRAFSLEVGSAHLRAMSMHRHNFALPRPRAVA